MYHLVAYNLLHYYVFQLENINFFSRSYSVTITMTFRTCSQLWNTLDIVTIKNKLLTHALSLNMFVSYTFSLIL